MVELDKKYNPGNTGTELDQSLLSSLPLPIYEAYKLLENQTDYEKSLQVLCLSLIPWTYQYIALILSGEYLESKYEPSFEVTDSLLNMVKKPGPGKWIGFARVASGYFMKHETSVVSHEAISVFNAILNEKNKPQVKVPDNENRLDYTDALISVRNRFAHSRSFTNEKATELFQNYFLIWKAFIVIIKEIFTPRLLFRSSADNTFQAFDHRSLDIGKLPSDLDNKFTLLWNDEKEIFIRLYPLIVNYSEDPKTNGGAAFLEEIKNKYLFYLQGDSFFKLKDEFEVLSGIIDSKTVREEEVTAGSLTFKTFGERIDRITSHTISDFQDALKYIPEIYLDRPAIADNLDSWLESNIPGCIIAGNPGTGKTSLITNWCIQRGTKGDHVLLFEASSLRESDITAIIEKELNLASPLKDCLDAVQKQNIELSGDRKPKRFIIVIDALNEFTGTNNESRSRLWREINSLISILNLYNPYLKCLVTTRSDLWAVDFPGKTSAYDMLKEKYFWGETKKGFPRVLLGDLSLAEAGEIFDKARNSVPSMAVQNSFDQLTERTKRVLCNPFFLRLALITFNGRKVPGLTKSKLQKHYAKERITEEKDKKIVLFALLERMSELRKTEVTIDEFLYAEERVKSKKKVSEKEKKNLEKLMYDPRPQSSYKKLIREGIIEEKTDEGGIESKEKIRFPQEKITDIIYNEFKQRDLNQKIKMVIILAIISFLAFGFVAFKMEKDCQTFNNKIKTEFGKEIKDQVKSVQIYNISSLLIKSVFHTYIKRVGLLGIILGIVVFSSIILLTYSFFWGARFIRNDLPSRFIKEKFNEIKQKKIWYILIPYLFYFLILYFIAFSNQPQSIDPRRIFLFSTPFLLIYYFFADLILGFIIVYRNANSPQDAFSMFGKNGVIQTCFEWIPTILIIIVFFWGSPKVPNLMDINKDEKLNNMRLKWNSDEAVIYLKDQYPDIYSKINKKSLNFINNDKLKLIDNFISELVNIVSFSLLILFFVYIILQYFIGFLLFKILKRRL